MITSAQKRRIKRNSPQISAVIKIAVDLHRATGLRQYTKAIDGKELLIYSPADEPRGVYRIKLNSKEMFDLRMALKLTRAQMAYKCGISAGHYARVESDESGYDPNVVVAARLACAIKGLEVEFDGVILYCPSNLVPVQQ
jgi:DNA-binding XRE family transcriptional regulator